MAAPTPEEFAALRDELDSLKTALGKAAGQTSSLGQASSLAFKQIGAGVSGFTTAMANGQQGASAFNGVVNSAGGALGTMLKELGPLGTAFGKLTEFAGAYIVKANQQGDALFKSFQDLSRVGGAGAEGMTGVFDNMQQFGMSMNQLPEFGAMITQNSEALAAMGGTVSQGTKAFAGVAAGIQQSGLQSEFQRMGLTTKNINEGTANYLRIQTLTGASANKTQAELTAGAAEYIQQQDRLSKLTGKSADALAKEEEARLSDQRYAAVTRELEQKAAAARAAGDEAGAKAAEDQIAQNRELMAQTPAALKQGVQDLMSGFVNSPEAKKMYTSLPEMSQSIMSQNYKASEVISKGASEATGALDRNTALAKAGLSNQVNADFAGLRDLEIKNRKQTAEESASIAKKEQEELKTGKNVDVNNQVALRQAQTATTIAMDNLVQKGVGPVTAGMLQLATGIEKVITTIPKQYIGEKTSTKARPGEKGSGRGEETPAAAGYGTNVKPEDFKKFIEESTAKGYQAISGPGVKKIDTGEGAHEYLSKKSKNITGETPKPTSSAAGPGANKMPTGEGAHEYLSKKSKNITGETPNPTVPLDKMQGFTSTFKANDILQQLQQVAAAGPNTNYRTNLGDTRPTTEAAGSTVQESTAGGNAELTQGIMTLANNIGSQTTSMNELVDLMRRSLGIQGKILQRSSN
jgi:hypothetical protein